MASTSDYMKQDIKAYLDDLAKKDDYFALCYENGAKNLDECLDYIVTQVQKSGRKGFHDNEIYGMAVHYYQEDNPGEIRNGIVDSCQCVTNHTIELTKEEIEQARQRAVDEIMAAEKKKIQEKERREKEAAKARAEEQRKKLAQEGVLSLW